MLHCTLHPSVLTTELHGQVSERSEKEKLLILLAVIHYLIFIDLKSSTFYSIYLAYSARS